MKEYIQPKKNIYYKANAIKKDRPTLLFVHGLSGSSSAFLPYEKKFKEKYNVVSLDLRGHGKSIKHNKYEEYTLSKFANDINDLIEYLKLENIILIGHSFGALIVLEFLSSYQNKIKAVVFLSPNYAVQKRKIAQVIKPFLAVTSIMKYLPFSYEIKGQVDYSFYENTGDWNLRRSIADIRNTSLPVYLYCTRQAYSFNKERLLGEITVPTLIVHGKKDTIFPAQYSMEMAEKIKKSKLVLLDNADHIVVLNNFSEVSAAIQNFTESL
ncbi:MAG: alpha/beta hydrolase [Patescibacteria group bacterium]|jgi:pimeloyl-ACP methyl ester carboxylesterase